MKISKGVEIIGTALWIKKEKVLIINDVHLGYEEVLQRRGILVPRFQLREMIKEMEKIFQKVKPKKIIINGDLKHEFGMILKQEWGEISAFLDFLIKHTPSIIIIQGNHDIIIKPIAEKKGIQVAREYPFDGTIIVHGDTLIDTKAKRIIIGHEHPAITLQEGSKREKYKCFLKGTWKGKEIIAVPSFNPLWEGTDVLKEEVLSPFLVNIQNFEVYIVGKGKVYGFGKIKALRL